MEENTVIKIYLGDKLPIIYDVAMAIHTLSPSCTKTGRRKVINAYSKEVHKMWLKAFGANHVISLSNVNNRVTDLMKDYDNKCYKAQSNSRRKGGIPETLRKLHSIWRSSKVPVKKHANTQHRNIQTNNDLFNIGKNLELLTGNEKIYYDDQCTQRFFRLSEECDVEYAEEMEKENEKLEQERSFTEEQETFSNPAEFQEKIPTKDRKSCGNVRLCSKCRKEGADEPHVTRDIRNGRNTLPVVKDTIATISYKVGISVPKARKAFQICCKMWNGEDYKLERDLETIPEEAEPPVSKKPRTAKDYESYRKVLPSVKSINTYKHLKAMSQEIAAADALMNKDDKTKVTLHYDTTSRSRIPGEWPCLSLDFLNNDPKLCKMFTLRALTFAFEDRQQITKLILETLARLSAATGGVISDKRLWENITAFMTDAVTKNLKVENLVAEKLGSDHIPYHLLCKAHTCEKLDECNENTLIAMEEKLNIRETIEKREPRLKSFIRKSKSVTKAAISALLQLVAKGGDGKTVSLSDEFDEILEEDGVYKSYSLYKEKRFTKLGYTAGAIYECLPQFKKLLERTHLNNLLVRACQIYLECDFVVAALRALSNFTYKVTMPYLNAVQQVDQNELITILPNLCDDLKGGSFGHTLDKYHVEWTHVCMEKQKPSSPLDAYMQKQMCINAGAGVELQCAREYWSESNDPRATQLFKLSEEERENLPSENLEPERYMAKVGMLAGQSAAHSNKRFKAKRMRDDLTFAKEAENLPEITSTQKKIFKELDIMELNWSTSQRNEYKKRLGEMMSRKQKRNDFVQSLLKKCKAHNGPMTDDSELKTMIIMYKGKDKELKSALQTEIQYQKHIHVKDAQLRPALYKVNNLTLDELRCNLMAMLTIDKETDGEHTLFHTEDEIMELLIPDSEGEVMNEGVAIKETAPYELQEPVAVVWEENSGELKWYIGFYLGKNNDDTFRLNHLVRSSTKQHDLWKWKSNNSDDIQDVQKEQIISVKVAGDWFFGKRVSTFVVENWSDIQDAFKEHFAF